MREKLVISKVVPFEVKEVAPRTLEFVGSTESKDREGDIIMASGWQLRQFKKNPVFLWAHNYQEPPIGKAVKVWAEDGKLKFHILFPDKDTYEFADTVFKLYKGGFLRASSVGFIPLESEPIEEKRDEDNFFMHVPTRFLKQELLELSGVPVPANPDALAEAKAKGILTENQLSDLSSSALGIMTDEALKAVDNMIGYVSKDALKPYPNEHACRLRDPDDFQNGSFKRTEREHEGKKYSIIMGRLEGETTMTEQAYRYDKDVWTAGEASKHCKDHDGTFEAASGGEAVTETEGYIQVEGEGNQSDADVRIVNQAEGEKPEPKQVSQEEIADSLDYLQIELSAVGLNAENIQRAWEIVRLIMREAGSDIPDDIAGKIGAVLNKVNRERLEKIKTLAQEVLDSAEKPDEPEKADKEEVSHERTIELITGSVQEVFDKARGKVQRR